jgi:hypothetical protein
MPYLLIASDAESATGGTADAKYVAEFRLRNGRWPLYENTPNRTQIRPGDECIIYLAGMGLASQEFLAAAVVDRLVETHNRRITVDPPDVITSGPETVVEFRDIRYFSPRVPIRPLLRDLSFITKNLQKWGASVRGGCRLISRADVDRILQSAREGRSVRTQ